MFSFNKKSGFTLAEILITLGLIGAVSAITIPTLAYNYRAKVLEEQYRSTYSDLKQIGAMINLEKGDIGEYANGLNSLGNWEKEVIGRLNGGGKLQATSVTDVTDDKRNIYRNSGANPGPFAFNLNGGQLAKVGDVCDNGSIWSDSKGRLWTFNFEMRIICVDVNGAANPNRLNIDTFAFIPMSAKAVAAWVYDDQAHPENYSGEIVPCDLDVITRKGLSNAYPKVDTVFDPTKSYTNGQKLSGNYTEVNNKNGNWKSAYDACPFFGPVENVAPTIGYSAGKSAKNRDITSSNNYWKDYINYK